MLIEDFIEKSNRAANPKDLFKIYLSALNNLGIDQVVYSFITDHKSCGQKAGHGIQNNFPDHWMDYYNDNGYQKIDPAVHHALRSPLPFTWEEIKKKSFLHKEQVKVLYEAEDAGLKNGVGIPLFGPNNEMAGVGLSSSYRNEVIDNNTLSKLKMLTEQFHMVYCSMSTPEEAVKIPELTKRETEVLLWLLRGKNAADMAIILNCSKATAKFHIQNIYRKLEANNVTLALSKAIYYGLLPIDVIISGSIID